jgi:hypothetical protein
MGNRGSASATSMVAKTVKVGGRMYEQRFVRCGKRNCGRCYPADGEALGRVGHGPYWYLCVTVGRRMRRAYIGSDLDTQRYVRDDGSVDWAATKGRREVRQEEG